MLCGTGACVAAVAGGGAMFKAAVAMGGIGFVAETTYDAVNEVQKFREGESHWNSNGVRDEQFKRKCFGCV